jgi:hypothetical protein
MARDRSCGGGGQAPKSLFLRLTSRGLELDENLATGRAGVDRALWHGKSIPHLATDGEEYRSGSGHEWAGRGRRWIGELAPICRQSRLDDLGVPKGVDLPSWQDWTRAAWEGKEKHA